ncbi:MAG: thiamine phosphate synthase [Ktedonobacterales bacterium]
MSAPTTPPARQTRLGAEELRQRLALHVLTDRVWSRGRGTLDVARAAIAGGATVIQLRDKLATTRLLVEEGLALRRLTRECGVLLIVNDRIDVALAVDADGAHVGQDDMPAPIARELLGPKRILGVSASSLAEAEVAVAQGADYLGVGPIYATRGKDDAGAPTGPALLEEIRERWGAMPQVAIGGIDARTVAAVMSAGAAGIAVITAVVSADDIAGVARTLIDSVRQAR